MFTVRKFLASCLLAPGFMLLTVMSVPVLAANFAGAAPVSDAQLAGLRGGFRIGNDSDSVWLSFSIDQLAYINGDLVATTHLGSPGQTGTTVISNGLGSHVVTTLPSGSLGTVIQNSLDDQTISNVNVFNVGVNSLQAAHWLSVQDVVANALVR